MAPERTWHRSTAPAFPLHGLEWQGRRTLDRICTTRREGVTTTYGVWLAHLADDGAGGGVRVGTFSTALLEHENTTAAERALFSLIDITMPPRWSATTRCTCDRRTAPPMAWCRACRSTSRTTAARDTSSGLIFGQRQTRVGQDWNDGKIKSFATHQD